MEASFRGPLPPPSLLKGYEDACPGAADRIISMAENQGAHRRSMEDRAATTAIDDMQREYAEARIGQIFGFIIALVMIAAGVYVAVAGHPWPGAALGGGGISVQAVAGLFIRGRKQAEQQESLPAATAPKRSVDAKAPKT